MSLIIGLFFSLVFVEFCLVVFTVLFVVSEWIAAIEREERKRWKHIKNQDCVDCLDNIVRVFDNIEELNKEKRKCV